MAIKKRTNLPKKFVVRPLKKIQQKGQALLAKRYEFANREPDNIDTKDLLRLQRGVFGSGYYPIAKAAEEASKVLRDRKRTTSNAATAIRNKCASCQGALPGEERELVLACEDQDCPLWAFRMGDDPFFNKR